MLERFPVERQHSFHVNHLNEGQDSGIQEIMLMLHGRIGDDDYTKELRKNNLIKLRYDDIIVL